ncbi:MAG: ThuA domain-containing protein [Verrucomicrobia bacterium]|nr:ThuA domain-containing protein [Verrucomicrobiota bacterium]
MRHSPLPRMFGWPAMFCVLLAAGGVTQAVELKKIVLLAGAPSQPSGMHEFRAGCLLFQQCLQGVPGLSVQVCSNGWPTRVVGGVTVDDNAVFEDAHAVVLYCDGGTRHPAVRADRVAVLDAVAARGGGLGFIHYAIEAPVGPPADALQRWIGGNYELLYSVNPLWAPQFTSLPAHPVTRGVQPFSTEDEWYFSLRWNANTNGMTPLLVATPSDDVRCGPYVYPPGPYPHVMDASGRPETTTWVLDRTNGHRGFGFTGGHRHANWGHPDQRRIVLNALLWLARMEVPAGGVPSVVTAAQLLENLDPKGNLAPVMSPVAPQLAEPLRPVSLQLVATDRNFPTQSMSCSLDSGPAGLTVSPGGWLTWTPSEAQAGGVYPVTVRVTDTGSPVMSDTETFTIEVAAGLRAVWSIGVDDSPSVPPYNPHGEFSSQNGRNDARPGLVTRVPGDPVYDANPAANPTADDDFYFAGAYPAGFHGLTSALIVPSDEPSPAWERGHTEGDRTNRLHVMLGAAQTGSGSRFRLTMEFASGGYSSGGVTQPGFGTHAMVVRFRNAAGVASVLHTQTLTAPGTLAVEFTAAQVAATAGPNSIEIVRTNPSVAGISSWIRYDFVRLEALPPANAAPVMAPPGDRSATPLIPLAFVLQSSDPDLPAQALTHALVSGPPGLTVSPGGLVTWTPSEAEAGGSHAVNVRVTDTGTPPMSDTESFTLHVAAGLRTVWSIGVDDSPSVLPYNPHGEFSNQNGRNDARPGAVTRGPGDPVYDANPSANPAADDDFYVAGAYPAGFNGLGAPLLVPTDEPATAWERGHTEGDRTNRFHLVLGVAQTGSATRFRLTLEFATGGFSVGGVTQPGFGSHTMVVRFRNAAGVVTGLRTQTLTAPATLSLEFTPAQVAAIAGANSIEIVRTNPSVAGTSSWIRYDYVRLEALPSAALGGTSFAASFSTSRGGRTRGGILRPSRPLDPELGIPPNLPEVRVGVVFIAGNRHRTLTFVEAAPLPHGMHHVAEASADGLTWSRVAMAEISRIRRGRTHEVTLRELMPMDSGRYRALRVRLVEDNPSSF